MEPYRTTVLYLIIVWRAGSRPLKFLHTALINLYSENEELIFRCPSISYTFYGACPPAGLKSELVKGLSSLRQAINSYT